MLCTLQQGYGAARTTLINNVEVNLNSVYMTYLN